MTMERIERSGKQEPETPRQSRKVYAPPRLTEYGDAETLTQATGSGTNDFGTMHA
jgi:hypothetical protein